MGSGAQWLTVRVGAAALICAEVPAVPLTIALAQSVQMLTRWKGPEPGQLWKCYYENSFDLTNPLRVQPHLPQTILWEPLIQNEFQIIQSGKCGFCGVALTWPPMPWHKPLVLTNPSYSLPPNLAVPELTAVSLRMAYLLPGILASFPTLYQNPTCS